MQEEQRPIEDTGDEVLGNLTADVESLKRKSVTGFGWATVQQAVGRITSFIIQLALARLLTPEDFGTVAVLSIFIAISTTLANAGFSSSLSRTETLDERDLSTVFYYNLGMSASLYLILFIAAPWIADYFHNPILIPILRVQSLSMVIYAVSSIQGILLWRRMEFKKQMYVQLYCGVISGAVGVGMAALGFGVWALVGMGLANALVNAGLLWHYSSWRPKRIFDKGRFKVHFDFGWRIALSGIIKEVYNNITTVFIGRYFSTRILGLYGQVNAFYVVPVYILADPINKVSYPIFIRVQSNIELLRAGYRKVMRLLVMISVPTLSLLAVLAHPLYHFLFGEKWTLAAGYFQILCLAGILLPLNDYNVNILSAKGRSDLYMRLDIVRRIIGGVGIFIALVFSSKWGVYGLLWSSVICQVIFLFVNSHYSGQFINYTLWQQLRELFPFFIMSGVSALVVWGVDTYLVGGLSDFLRLAIGGCVMALMYLGLLLLFMRQDLLYVYELVLHHLLKRKTPAEAHQGH